MFVCRDAVLDATRPRRAASVAALPLVGSVAAGVPRLAEQDVEDWITSPFEGDFVLRVTGDSMIDAGHPRRGPRGGRAPPTADDGEIVVAQIEDEATVKRLKRADGRVHLMPENDAFEPIVPDEVTLLGVVVGVMRKL